MAHTYVKVKHQEKVLKLLPATVSVTNLAMIFKLETQHGIYIHSEEEAEIILPSESGTFLVEDFSKTYVVNGEPAVSVIPPVNYRNPLPRPLDYRFLTNNLEVKRTLHPVLEDLKGQLLKW